MGSMRNGKKRTAATVTFMTILAVVIIITYFYWTNRTQPLRSSENKLTEVQKMADTDLELYYPKTPTQLVKLFAGMMKTMYNHPSDNDIKALALKVRELYDPEFLKSNPEKTYLKNLYEELADWKKKNRRITKYVLTEQDKNLEKEISGVNYATRYIKFTLQESTKFTETWDVLMRQDKNGQWKILGWKVTENNN